MKKLALLFAAFFCMSGFTTTANAIGISIDVGDRPYYTYGPRYWARGAYWCWVWDIGAGITASGFTVMTDPAD